MNIAEKEKKNWKEQYCENLRELIRNYGTVHTPQGLEKTLSWIEERLSQLDFSLKRIQNKGKGDILVAVREPIQSKNWLGLYGHYDVEPIEEGWLTDPTDLVEKDGRLYGRGTGDNLGPLVLRIMALEERTKETPTPGLFWLLQGEEEIGSPHAHEVFPSLDRPEAALWLEETGYFNEAGDQRFLVKNSNQQLEELLDSLSQISQSYNRKTYREDRYLNKAFGEHKCPYLNHIVKHHPYLGIGPNDDQTGVHAPNESIPISTLELSAHQFNYVLDRVAIWN